MHDLNLDDRGLWILRLFMRVAIVFSLTGFGSTVFYSAQDQGHNAGALFAVITVLLSRRSVTELVRRLLERLLIDSLSLIGTDNL
jgi:hypothetical protein